MKRHWALARAWLARELEGNSQAWTVPDWRRVGALFDEALALDAGARAARLLRARGAADPARRRGSAALLARARQRRRLPRDARPGPSIPSCCASRRRTAADRPRASVPIRVREEVGRGGMGVVYAAEDARLGRTVALKVLPPAFSRDRARARAAGARGARRRRASHPGIATVYALEEIDGDCSSPASWCAAHAARRSSPPGRCPPERAARDAARRSPRRSTPRTARASCIATSSPRTCCATRTAASRSSTSASRGTLTPPPRRTALTLTGTRLGTPGYMAPEQLRGQPVDARADVFAFGVMAYELATGRHPFGQGDPASLLERVVGDAPFTLDAQPAALRSILRRCLRADHRALSIRGGNRCGITRAPVGSDACRRSRDHGVRPRLVVAVPPGRGGRPEHRGRDAPRLQARLVRSVGFDRVRGRACFGDHFGDVAPSPLVYVGRPPGAAWRCAPPVAAGGILPPKPSSLR